MSRLASLRLLLAFLICLLLLAASSAPAQQAAPAPAFDPNNTFFAIKLPGFFSTGKRGAGRGGAGQLKFYLIRRDGQWAAGLANSNSDTGRPAYNTSLYNVDLSGLTIKDKKVAGKITVTFNHDGWVPHDKKVHHATIALDATLNPPAMAGTTSSLTGTWSATSDGAGSDSGLPPAAEGKVTGDTAPLGPPGDYKDASINMAMYGLIPGKTDEEFQRRRGLSIGVQDGKPVSARLAQMDIRHNMYDWEVLDTPDSFEFKGDQFSGAMTFTGQTLDGDSASFTLQLTGQRVANWVVGTYKGKYVGEDGKDHEITGFFKGDIRPGAFVSTAARDTRPWFKEVPGFKPFAPGEHPRLFFRKADMDELHRRAKTPEGLAILARLRQLLNGSDGESMPTSYNPATKAYDKNNFRGGPGTYTISHAAGYGFLYQLTGDRKYAGFARECVEKAFAGQRNSDDRYSWVMPGGELRAGPTIGWTAVAYDLCYDAWPEDFRIKVAQAIQNYSDVKGGEWNVAEGITLRKMILTPKQGPSSNHYGAVVGGCGLAVLAIKDDPGTDKELLNKYMDMVEKQVIRHYMGGWGDGGYYKEGWGASRVGTQGGFLCLLQALKVAYGHDYLNVDRPSATFSTMIPRSLLVLGPPGYFPYRSNMGPTYGNPEIGSYDQRAGFSHGGYFSEGFGAVADIHKPALLWTYNHVFNADGKDVFDTLSPYPHRAMLALINWPTFSGIQEKNPAEILPLVTHDHMYDLFNFRNKFSGPDDVVASVILNYPDGTNPRDVLVWGMGGLRLRLGEPPRGAKVTFFQPGKDGSGSLAAGEWAMAVDYSKASGADAVIVTLGAAAKDIKDSPRAKLTTFDVPGKKGGSKLNVLTLSASSQHPAPAFDKTRLTVGGQTFTLDNGRLKMAVFTPMPEGLYGAPKPIDEQPAKKKN